LILSRCTRLLILSIVLIAAAVAATTSSARPAAHAAGRCNTGSRRNLGYTYVTSLKVSRTSCSNGKKLVKHHGKLAGWHCSRKLLDRSPVQFDARMTCKSGGRNVTWTFTQDT
jgi:hypothetical protein